MFPEAEFCLDVEVDTSPADVLGAAGVMGAFTSEALIRARTPGNASVENRSPVTNNTGQKAPLTVFDMALSLAICWRTRRRLVGDLNMKIIVGIELLK